MQLVQSANFAQDLSRLDEPQLNSSSDSDVRASTLYDGVFAQEPGGSLSSKFLGLELIEESAEVEPKAEWIRSFLNQMLQYLAGKFTLRGLSESIHGRVR